MFGSVTKPDSYVEIKSEDLKVLCRKSLELIEESRQAALKEFAEQHLAKENRWRKWFFLKPIERKWIDVICDIKYYAGSGFTPAIQLFWVEARYTDPEDTTHRLLRLCKSSDKVFVSGRDLQQLYSDNAGSLQWVWENE
jgi:hypothetical protein